MNFSPLRRALLLRRCFYAANGRAEAGSAARSSRLSFLDSLRCRNLRCAEFRFSCSFSPRLAHSFTSTSARWLCSSFVRRRLSPRAPLYRQQFIEPRSEIRFVLISPCLDVRVEIEYAHITYSNYRQSLRNADDRRGAARAHDAHIGPPQKENKHNKTTENASIFVRTNFVAAKG